MEVGRRAGEAGAGGGRAPDGDEAETTRPRDAPRTPRGRNLWAAAFAGQTLNTHTLIHTMNLCMYVRVKKDVSYIGRSTQIRTRQDMLHPVSSKFHLTDTIETVSFKYYSNKRLH